MLFRPYNTIDVKLLGEESVGEDEMKKVSIVGKMLVGAVTLFGLTGATITSAASWTVSQEKASEKGRWSTYGKRT